VNGGKTRKESGTRRMHGGGKREVDGGVLLALSTSWGETLRWKGSYACSKERGVAIPSEKGWEKLPAEGGGRVLGKAMCVQGKNGSTSFERGTLAVKKP